MCRRDDPRKVMVNPTPTVQYAVSHFPDCTILPDTRLQDNA
jgi:hypothetical protein